MKINKRKRKKSKETQKGRVPQNPSNRKRNPCISERQTYCCQGETRSHLKLNVRL